MFAKFGQYAAGRFGMQECNLQFFCAWARCFVNEADALCIAFSQCVGHAVFDTECHMVYTTTAFFKELGYGTVGTRRLQQLEFHFTYLQEGGLYFLVLYLFDGITLQT